MGLSYWGCIGIHTMRAPTPMTPPTPGIQTHNESDDDEDELLMALREFTELCDEIEDDEPEPAPSRLDPDLTVEELDEQVDGGIR